MTNIVTSLSKTQSIQGSSGCRHGKPAQARSTDVFWEIHGRPDAISLHAEEVPAPHMKRKLDSFLGFIRGNVLGKSIDKIVVLGRKIT